MQKKIFFSIYLFFSFSYDQVLLIHHNNKKQTLPNHIDLFWTSFNLKKKRNEKIIASEFVCYHLTANVCIVPCGFAFNLIKYQHNMKWKWTLTEPIPFNLLKWRQSKFVRNHAQNQKNWQKISTNEKKLCTPMILIIKNPAIEKKLFTFFFPANKKNDFYFFSVNFNVCYLFYPLPPLPT